MIININLDSLIKRRLQRFTDNPASRSWNEFVYKIYNKRLYDHLEDFSNGLPANSIVLDLGCGEGEDINRLTIKNNWYGIGIDISLEAIRRALHNAKRCPKSQMQTDFIQADANFLPFRNDAFDGIYIMYVLHHLSNLSALRCLHKIAKTGGRLLICDLPGTNPSIFLERKVAQYLRLSSLAHGESFSFFSPSMLERAIREAGFNIEKESRRDYFIGFIGLLFQILGRPLLSNRILMALYYLEEFLEKAPIMKDTCKNVIFLCSKHML